MLTSAAARLDLLEHAPSALVRVRTPPGMLI
jgi:hypothetical protein